jgi:hypothetical protein
LDQVTREQFIAVRSKEVEPYKRIRAFAALLAEESGLGSDRLTAVGGSALEIHTTGDYVSADIDLVAEEPRKVESVLVEWGFQKRGMFWELPEFGTSVQIVGRFDSGSSELSQVVLTPHGKVRLASMEDILWKRIYESRGWNRLAALDEAALLVRRYWDRIRLGLPIPQSQGERRGGPRQGAALIGGRSILAAAVLPGEKARSSPTLMLGRACWRERAVFGS